MLELVCSPGGADGHQPDHRNLDHRLAVGGEAFVSRGEAAGCRPSVPIGWRERPLEPPDAARDREQRSNAAIRSIIET
jgi:hypothetical protein